MSIKNFVKRKIRLLLFHLNLYSQDWEDRSLILQAKILMSSESWLRKEDNFDLTSKEFRVFSQWGDDGIIQYLISQLNIQNK